MNKPNTARGGQAKNGDFIMDPNKLQKIVMNPIADLSDIVMTKPEIKNGFSLKDRMLSKVCAFS